MGQHWGPLFWTLMHAAAAQRNAVELLRMEFVYGTATALLPCAMCRLDARLYLHSHPPMPGQLESFVSDFHAAVNNKLRKPAPVQPQHTQNVRRTDVLEALHHIAEWYSPDMRQVVERWVHLAEIIFGLQLPGLQLDNRCTLLDSLAETRGVAEKNDELAQQAQHAGHADDADDGSGHGVADRTADRT